jgi:hypothetical protein
MRGNERGLHENHVTPFVLEVIKSLGAFSDRLLSSPKGVLISLNMRRQPPLTLKGGENNDGSN